MFYLMGVAVAKRIAIVNGLIFTARPDRMIADAVLVVKDRIVHVGTTSAILSRSEDCIVIDADGYLVTPGFIDTHCHLAQAGYLSKYGVNLVGIKSLDEIIDIIARKAKKIKPGEWIYGYGWDESLLKEKRPIYKEDLDNASSQHPIVLEHISGHLIAVNSLALKIAKITKDTPDPPGGIIERDESGNPIGILRDSAMSLITQYMPKPTLNDWIKSIESAQMIWIKKGITAIEDVGVLGQGGNILKAYKYLADYNKLLLRVRFSYPITKPGELNEHLIKVLKSINTSNLRISSIKVFYDGSGIARTALMYEDWCEEFKVCKGNKGLRLITVNELEDIIALSNAKGLRVSIHAIGDKAIDEVVKAISIIKAFRKAQYSIIHAIVPTEEAVELMAQLGIGVKTQTSFIYSYGHVYAANLCIDRARRAFPIKTMLRKGVIVGNGSDAPYLNPPDPSYGLYGAIARKPRIKTILEHPFGTQECISFIEAIETYTRLASITIGWDDQVGCLEKGKKGDIVIWNIKSLNPSPQEILHLKPLLTMIDGNIVYISKEWKEKLNKYSLR